MRSRDKKRYARGFIKLNRIRETNEKALLQRELSVVGSHLVRRHENEEEPKKCVFESYQILHFPASSSAVDSREGTGRSIELRPTQFRPHFHQHITIIPRPHHSHISIRSRAY